MGTQLTSIPNPGQFVFGGLIYVMDPLNPGQFVPEIDTARFGAIQQYNDALPVAAQKNQAAVAAFRASMKTWQDNAVEYLADKVPDPTPVPAIPNAIVPTLVGTPGPNGGFVAPYRYVEAVGAPLASYPNPLIPGSGDTGLAGGAFTQAGPAPASQADVQKLAAQLAAVEAQLAQLIAAMPKP